MANTILADIYRINSNNLKTPIAMGVPVASSLFRPLTDQQIGNQYVNAVIQLLPSNDQYFTDKTVTQLVTEANA